MATGELTKRVDESELGYGEALTSSGRVSAAKMYEPAAPTSPFSTRQLARLDEALTFASRETGLDFSLYLGELGDDSRSAAEKLHATTADPANSVLIAVSPGERADRDRDRHDGARPPPRPRLQAGGGEHGGVLQGGRPRPRAGQRPGERAAHAVRPGGPRAPLTSDTKGPRTGWSRGPSLRPSQACASNSRAAKRPHDARPALGHQPPQRRRVLARPATRPTPSPSPGPPPTTGTARSRSAAPARWTAAATPRRHPRSTSPRTSPAAPSGPGARSRR